MKRPGRRQHKSARPEEGSSRSDSLYCGVDVGASATKAVLVDEQGEMRGKAVLKSGVDYQASAKVCLQNALASIPAWQERVVRSVATGYGRRNVDFADEIVTEITCHGRGCHHFFPQGVVVVDIGGQDSKVIRLAADGRRLNFKMNRKCAAGTGAFLEEIAARLDIPLEDLDRLARGGDKEFTLGSFCTVFTKTEILAYIRKGERVENIIRGAFHSVVHRIIEMDRLEGDVVLTGGVVQYNPYLSEALGKELRREVLVPPDPQFTGALGAALIAREG